MRKAGSFEKAVAALRIERCYQCGKCSAGCPMGAAMDAPPHRIMQWVGRGAVDRAIRAESIWLCVSCQTCTARCPQTVDTAGVMDEVRALAWRKGICSPAMLRSKLFLEAFLDTVRRHGRLNETELIAKYKVRGFLRDFRVALLLKDSMLAPRLIKRGKFHLFGGKAGDNDVIKRIFERCERAVAHDEDKDTPKEASHG